MRGGWRYDPKHAPPSRLVQRAHRLRQPGSVGEQTPHRRPGKIVSQHAGLIGEYQVLGADASLQPPRHPAKIPAPAVEILRDQGWRARADHAGHHHGRKQPSRTEIPLHCSQSVEKDAGPDEEDRYRGQQVEGGNRAPQHDEQDESQLENEE
jgi:hypothetical protein